MWRKILNLQYSILSKMKISRLLNYSMDMCQSFAKVLRYVHGITMQLCTPFCGQAQSLLPIWHWILIILEPAFLQQKNALWNCHARKWCYRVSFTIINAELTIIHALDPSVSTQLTGSFDTSLTSLRENLREASF